MASSHNERKEAVESPKDQYWGQSYLIHTYYLELGVSSVVDQVADHTK